jgi:hypothetical protein
MAPRWAAQREHQANHEFPSTVNHRGLSTGLSQNGHNHRRSSWTLRVLYELKWRIAHNKRVCQALVTYQTYSSRTAIAPRLAPHLSKALRDMSVFPQFFFPPVTFCTGAQRIIIQEIGETLSP